MRDVIMTMGAIGFASDFFDPVRRIGPIFDKELRVSSRRRRNYTLRCAYIGFLSLFILSAWYSTFGIRSSGSVVYQVSRLPLVSRSVVTTVVWFQFITAQFIAAIMLSSSISDEIRTGTLAVLMTTPVNSFQIVAGKLLSKLLQLMLLLAISLPLLAILRIFGGVPWDYVISSVCITLTASVFAGALSLLLSMICRRAHNVIILVIIAYLIVFAALPAILAQIAAAGLLDQKLTHSLLALTNPFWALLTSTRAMLLPGGAATIAWHLHCLLMLACTTVLITVSVWRVRRSAMLDASGRSLGLRFWRARKPKGRDSLSDADSGSSTGSIKPVTGRPIVWKEMRKGFIGGRKLGAKTSALLIGLFLLAAISPLFTPRGFIFFPYLLISGLYLIIMIRMAVFSAGGITVEKEARTWPILLATPLEDKEIVRGKAIAAFRRNLPLLLLYFAMSSILFLTARGRPGRVTSLQTVGSLLSSVFSMAGSALFVIGSGLYFGVRSRTTGLAVAATIGSYLAVTFLFGTVFTAFFWLVLKVATSGGRIWIPYATSIIHSLFLVLIGLLLVRGAARRVRRNIF